MGIAWLLLQRTFAAKPKRTLLFLLGYALATAVMVTLLAVGEAVLQQARDKNLMGGGDLILVPQGIDLESMKVGGISALYYSIPEARFIVRQFLQSSRFQNDIDTVSPYIVPKLVYIRHAGQQEPPHHAFAEGSLPDQENRIKNLRLPWHNTLHDNSWLEPSHPDFYHEIDHFHLPSVDSPDMQRWAEWHYFNFESSGAQASSPHYGPQASRPHYGPQASRPHYGPQASRLHYGPQASRLHYGPRVSRPPDSFYGYLSIMAAGDILKNEAEWIVSLQIYDGKYHRYSTTYPATLDSLPLKTIDYRAGPNQIRFEKDHYEIDLKFADPVPVEGKLQYYPAEGLYFPPTFLARRSDFESGYVIPAIRGKYRGTLRIGGMTYDFNGTDGYHDHNWGIWRQLEWNWGHAYSKEFAIFFGEIYLQNKSKGIFAGVYDSKGFVTLLHPDRIHFSDYKKTADGLLVPMSFTMEAQKRFSSMKIHAKADRFVTTALEDQPLYFVQYKMTYDVQLQIDGKEHQFTATGNAETFVK